MLSLSLSHLALLLCILAYNEATYLGLKDSAFIVDCPCIISCILVALTPTILWWQVDDKFPKATATTTTTMASIGMKSFWELGSAFVNTMYGYDVFPTPNVYTCSRLGSDGRTMEPAFFLNMNLFTSNDSGQQHECDGSDWISTYIACLHDFKHAPLSNEWFRSSHYITCPLSLSQCYPPLPLRTKREI